MKLTSNARFVGIATVLLVAACRDPLGAPLSSWTPDAASILLLNDFSGIEAPKQEAIVDSSAWSSALQKISDLPTSIPTVDFRTHTVLLAAMGAQPTSAFSVRIDRVELHEHGAAVYVTERYGCDGYTVVITPLHAVAAPFRFAVWDWRTTRHREQC